MTSRAEASVFLPGITSDIYNMRAQCSQCNRMAPSRPNPPPTPSANPVYPFQSIFFHFPGTNCLFIVDRYSNCPIVEKAAGGSKSLIFSLRRTFVAFGISDELSSDGGQNSPPLQQRLPQKLGSTTPHIISGLSAQQL